MATVSSDRSSVLSLSSLFMGFLFAYSASVQLNDPDWYFWFPLHALASGVNLLGMNFTWRAINYGAVLALYWGTLLLIKVVVEAQVYGLCSIWSMDMRERLVREKIGSGLVIVSMYLHVRTSASDRGSVEHREALHVKCLVNGYTTIVALAFGLSLYFFVFVRQEMKM